MAEVWKRIEPTTTQKIGWRTVISKTFQMPNGKVATFETINPEDWKCAGCIAITTDNRVVVSRQFRVGPEKIMDELPGGVVDAEDENTELAARRELLEETGYEAGAMEFIGSLPRDAYMNGTWYYYLATDCKLAASGASPDDREHIDIVTISIERFVQNARTGMMSDPAAVLMAYERLQELAALPKTG